ncbi:uncharacterized protein METZ01_LOCUS268009 [marine metagenome]|uniref:Uncharacterized protein n=1 Tax=marine metagenome TaxID=408172 RepID=A0A382JU19_9ZZZZ
MSPLQGSQVRHSLCIIMYIYVLLGFVCGAIDDEVERGCTANQT